MALSAIITIILSLIILSKIEAKSVKLSDNNLVTTKIIQRLEKPKTITTLDLSKNKLSSLAQEDFEKMTSLIDLNLSNNQLSEIDLTIFSPCKKLRRINCSGNIIKKIIPGSEKNSSLKILNLSNNQLTKLPDPLIIQSKLHDLDLSYNQLSSIEKLESLEKIRHLNLAHNQLKTDNFIKLEALKKLNSLNLSHNQLTEIKEWPTLSRLHSLDLSNNKLTDLKNFSHKKNPELIWIDLSNNAFISSETLLQFTQYRSLIHINLSGNNLIETGFFKELKKKRCEVISNADILKDH